MTKYNLDTFAGRLTAIAAGETLQFDYDTGPEAICLKDDKLVGPDRHEWTLHVLRRNYNWSLVPRPEKTVTITRKQLLESWENCIDADYGKFEALAFDLGLGLGDVVIVTSSDRDAALKGDV